MEVLLIAFYLGLFDIIGSKIWILISLQSIYQYLIVPNVINIKTAITRRNNDRSLKNSCVVLCIGSILVLYHTWTCMLSVMNNVHHFVSKVYVVKLIENRCTILENRYQSLKKEYLMSFKQSIIQYMMKNIQQSDNPTVL